MLARLMRIKHHSWQTTKNEEGALYSLLEPFNALDINLSHLTYRPSKINKWQYSFFIDF